MVAPPAQQRHDAEQKKEQRDEGDRAIRLLGRIEARRPADVEEERAEERHRQRAHPRKKRQEDQRGDVEQRHVREELDLAIDAGREQDRREESAGERDAGQEFRSMPHAERHDGDRDQCHRAECGAVPEERVRLRCRPDR